MMQSVLKRHLLTTALAGLLAAPMPALSENALRQVNFGTGAATVAAKTGEVVEILLADGTSVVLAPGSEVHVSSDGAQVDILLTGGLMRVSGGAGAGDGIRIQTPQGTARLRAGVAVVAAENGATRAHLIAGEEIVLRCGKRNRTLYRPGFQSVCKGTGPSVPRKMTAADLAADIARLSAVLKQGASGGGGGTGGGAAGVGGAAPGGGIRQAGVGDGSGEDLAAPVTSNEDSPDVEPPFGTIDLAGVFGIEEVEAGEKFGETSTTIVDGRNAGPAQELHYPPGSIAQDLVPEPFRFFGPTTNRVGFPVDFALPGEGMAEHGALNEDGGGLSFFVDTAGEEFGVKLADIREYGDPQALFHLDASSQVQGVISADTFFLRDSNLPFARGDSTFGPFEYEMRGSIFRPAAPGDLRNYDASDIQNVFLASDLVFAAVFDDLDNLEGFEIESGTPVGLGSDLSFYGVPGIGATMDGLAFGELNGVGSDGVRRELDNFFFARIDGAPTFQMVNPGQDPRIDADVMREAVAFYVAEKFPEATAAKLDSGDTFASGLILDAPTGQSVTFAAGDLDGAAGRVGGR